MVPFSRIPSTIAVLHSPAAKSDWSDKLHTTINNTAVLYLHSLLNHVSFLFIDFL